MIHVVLRGQFLNFGALEFVGIGKHVSISWLSTLFEARVIGARVGRAARVDLIPPAGKVHARQAFSLRRSAAADLILEKHRGKGLANIFTLGYKTPSTIFWNTD